MKSFLYALWQILISFLIAFGIVAWVYLIADAAASSAIRKHEQLRQQSAPVKAPEKA